MVETKYEKVGSCEMTLSVCAVIQAINKIGESFQFQPNDTPLIVARSGRFGELREIQASLKQETLIGANSTLGEYEWYVEWGGRRAGSTGW